MQPLSSLHVYEDAVPRSAAANMGLDEALLESAPAPTLRFYGWRRASLSFGYFGRYADVAHEENEREIVRRWTGGGIVLHGTDLTYSVILPARASEKLPPARAIYAAIHDAIRRALVSAAPAALATADAPKRSDACFANPVVADVLVDGEKIAGAAQRRTRAGLLHQGSIQFAALPPDFRKRFAAELCPSFEPKQLSGAISARAEELAARKYATAEWLRSR